MLDAILNNLCWIKPGVGGHAMATWAGDNTLLGWISTVAYLLTAFLCVRAAQRETTPNKSHARRFWAFVACLLLFLGLNKQLDIQTTLIDAARSMARQQGWYQDRGIVQIIFVVMLALTAIACLVWLFWVTRHAWRTHAIALFGVALIIGFVVLRVAYFEKMERLIGIPLTASRAKWVLELGGILCIAIGACRPNRTQSA
jgi:hypothetical protein